MHYNEDAMIVALADNKSVIEINRLPNNFKKMDNVLISKLRSNKISIEVIRKIDESIELKLQRDFVNEKLLAEEWVTTFKKVNFLLNKKKIIFVFIKTLKYPNTVMNDVDILPLDIIEEIKALKVLSENGFEHYKIRILAHPFRSHPFKISSKKKDGKIYVDFYPVPMWTRKRIHENVIILDRKKVETIFGVQANVPSSEDDLYLIATHSFNDFKIPLATILHSLELLEKTFDWEYLYNLAKTYGTLDAIYVFLKVIKEYSRIFRDKEAIDNDVLHYYEYHKVCKRIKKWFEKTYANRLTFPIKIPFRIGAVFSSVYHTPKLIGSIKLSELFYDFSSHYYSPLALTLNELKDNKG